MDELTRKFQQNLVLGTYEIEKFPGISTLSKTQDPPVLKTFRKFPQLPPELRASIWRLSQLSPKVFHYDTSYGAPKQRLEPARLLICHEAWKVQTRHHSYRTFRPIKRVKTLRPSPRGLRGLINGDIDVLNLEKIADMDSFIFNIRAGVMKRRHMRGIKHIQIEVRVGWMGIEPDISDYLDDGFPFKLQEVFMYCPDLESLVIWFRCDNDYEGDEYDYLFSPHQIANLQEAFQHQLQEIDFQDYLVEQWGDLTAVRERFERLSLWDAVLLNQMYPEGDGDIAKWNVDRERWSKAVKYRVTDFEASYMPPLSLLG